MIERIAYIDGLLQAHLPPEEYVVVNSAWLAVMGVRVNGDLDVLLSSKLWANSFADKPAELSFGIPGPLETRVRVHALEGGPYGSLPEIGGHDNAVYRYRILIDGVPFIEPRWYFLYKRVRLENTERTIGELPWWRRHVLVSKPVRKLYLKRDKDRRDFGLIRSFFEAGRHRKGIFAGINDEQWGLTDSRINGLLVER